MSVGILLIHDSKVVNPFLTNFWALWDDFLIGRWVPRKQNQPKSHTNPPTHATHKEENRPTSSCWRRFGLGRLTFSLARPFLIADG